MPERGQFEFEDLETGQRIKTNVQSIADRYQKIVQQWRESLQIRFDNAGIQWLSCHTDQPLVDVLIDYLIRRDVG